MAENVCDCPKPPGGRVVCRQNQLAICRWNDGEVESACIDPPLSASGLSDKRGNTVIRNWALSVITGAERTSDQILTAEDHGILSEGRYHNKETGQIVTFSLPEDLRAKTAEVREPVLSR